MDLTRCQLGRLHLLYGFRILILPQISTYKKRDGHIIPISLFIELIRNLNDYSLSDFNDNSQIENTDTAAKPPRIIAGIAA